MSLKQAAKAVWTAWTASPPSSLAQKVALQKTNWTLWMGNW